MRSPDGEVLTVPFQAELIDHSPGLLMFSILIVEDDCPGLGDKIRAGGKWQAYLTRQGSKVSNEFEFLYQTLH